MVCVAVADRNGCLVVPYLVRSVVLVEIQILSEAAAGIFRITVIVQAHLSVSERHTRSVTMLINACPLPSMLI